MSQSIYRTRRIGVASIITLCLLIYGFISYTSEQRLIREYNQNHSQKTAPSNTPFAVDALETLEVKGRAPKTDYSRSMFGAGWATHGDCTTRELVLIRDLKETTVSADCKVQQGTLRDPYTDSIVEFQRGPDTSDDVQIDHVVALSDAWQKGAQQLTQQTREALANDPLELLAVDGPTNQKKGDGDAATWLPPNKLYRCQYVARQIAVKKKYSLWVTAAEKDAMKQILERCPAQQLPG